MKLPNEVRLFLIDDDVFFGNIVKNKLEEIENLDVNLFSDPTTFVDSLFLLPDIVIIDYDLPGTNGLVLLQKVKEILPEALAVFLSGQKDLQVVVNAYKQGAESYIMKDENALIEIHQAVVRHKENLLLKRQFEALRDQVIQNNHYKNLIGDSLPMQQLFRVMKKVEKVAIPILITGPNGTGKELVAQALHYNSDRSRRPFVAINVAAIPEDLIESELFGSEKGAFTGATRRYGKFEEANRGTIFLDEIGEMPLGVQSKLLRVLQENSVTRLGGNKSIDLDIRILSATNKNLWEEVKKGRFREDLYFRLQGLVLEIPSLKDRENDIIQLAKYFIHEYSLRQRIPEKSLSPKAIQAMMEYTWPGNVRELKSMIERAMLLSESDIILVEDLIFLQKVA